MTLRARQWMVTVVVAMIATWTIAMWLRGVLYGSGVPISLGCYALAIWQLAPRRERPLRPGREALADAFGEAAAGAAGTERVPPEVATPTPPRTSG